MALRNSLSRSSEVSSLSSLIILSHAVLLAAGNESMYLVWRRFTVFDLVLLVYVFLNLEAVRKVIWRLRDFLVPLVGFTGIAVCSTLWNYIIGANPVLDLVTFTRFGVYGLIFICYFDYLTRAQRFGNVLLAFGAGLILVLANDILGALRIGYDIVGHFGFYLGAAVQSGDELMNTNDFAFLTSTGAPLFLLPFFDRRVTRGRLQTIGLLSCGTALFALSVVSGQKTGYLPWFWCLGVLALGMWVNRDVAKRVAFISILAFGIFAVLNTKLGLTWTEIAQILIRRTGRSEAVVKRWDFMTSAVDIAFTHYPFSFVVGVGKNAFEHLTGVNDPHNINLQIFLETGLIGFIVYLWFIMLIMRHAFRISTVYGIIYLGSFLIISNAIGQAFQSHAAWIGFAMILSIDATSEQGGGSDLHLSASERRPTPAKFGEPGSMG